MTNGPLIGTIVNKKPVPIRNDMLRLSIQGLNCRLAYRGYSLISFPTTLIEHPYVGIEFEYEFSPLAPLAPAKAQILECVGKVESDHSLRNGQEFKTIPLPIDIAIQLLPILYQIIGKEPPAAAFSWRTSTHVHINMAAWPLHKFQAFVGLCLLLEPALQYIASPEREASVFCRPISAAIPAIMLGQLLTACPNNNNFEDAYHQISEAFATWKKYCGINLKPLLTFGTIEFRQFPGFSDVQKLSDWLTIIKEMYRAVDNGLSFQNVMLVGSAIKQTSQFGTFIHSVFSPSIANLFLKVPLNVWIKGPTYLRLIPLTKDMWAPGPITQLIHNFNTKGDH